MQQWEVCKQEYMTVWMYKWLLMQSVKQSEGRHSDSVEMVSDPVSHVVDRAVDCVRMFLLNLVLTSHRSFISRWVMDAVDKTVGRWQRQRWSRPYRRAALPIPNLFSVTSQWRRSYFSSNFNSLETKQPNKGKGGRVLRSFSFCSHTKAASPWDTLDCYHHSLGIRY